MKGDEQRIRPIEVQLTAVEANRADIVTKDTVYKGQLIVCYSATGHVCKRQQIVYRTTDGVYRGQQIVSTHTGHSKPFAHNRDKHRCA